MRTSSCRQSTCYYFVVMIIAVVSMVIASPDGDENRKAWSKFVFATINRNYHLQAPQPRRDFVLAKLLGKNNSANSNGTIFAAKNRPTLLLGNNRSNGIRNNNMTLAEKNLALKNLANRMEKAGMMNDNFIKIMAQRLQQAQQRKRFEKCMDTFKSAAICKQTSAFYIWEQKIAKSIMDGKEVWD